MEKKNFTYGAHHLIIINFTWGKIINQEEGGGGNIIFKFNIHTREKVAICGYSDPGLNETDTQH